MKSRSWTPWKLEMEPWELWKLEMDILDALEA